MKAKPQFESKKFIELMSERIKLLTASIRCREKYIAAATSGAAKGNPLSAV